MNIDYLPDTRSLLTMPLRTCIIIFLTIAAVAVTVTVVVTHDDRDAMTPIEYRELIREAIDSGDYELVADIPAGVYGDVEIVEEIDSKSDPGIRRALTRIRKVIRDRSKYAKAGKDGRSVSEDPGHEVHREGQWFGPGIRSLAESRRFWYNKRCTTVNNIISDSGH